MPTRVQAPDGSLIDFPDEMDDNAITGAMQKLYPPTAPEVSASKPPSEKPGLLTRAYRAVEPVVTGHAIKSLGGPTLSELYDKAFPPNEGKGAIQQAGEFSRRLVRAIPEIGDFLLTPVGAATVPLGAAGPAARAGLEAAFATQGARAIPEAVKELKKNPSGATAAEAVKASAMTALPVVHAVSGIVRTAPRDIGTPAPVGEPAPIEARPVEAQPDSIGVPAPVEPPVVPPPAEVAPKPVRRARKPVAQAEATPSPDEIRAANEKRIAELEAQLAEQRKAEPQPETPNAEPLPAVPSPAETGPRTVENPAGEPATQESVGEPPKPEPTAAIPTVPETRETLAEQVAQLGEGKRKVVMFPKGTPEEDIPDLPNRNIEAHQDPQGNWYFFDPDKIEPEEINAAVAENRLPEILGPEGGMGAPDKSQLSEPVAAVVGRTPEGVTTQATATDAENLPGAIEQTGKVTPSNGTVSVENPATEVENRARFRDPLPTRAPLRPPVVQPPEPQARTAHAGERGFAAGELVAAPLEKAGVGKFIEKDVLPGAKFVGRGIGAVLKNIQETLAPQTVNASAKKGAGTVREMMGERMQREAQAHAAMDQFRKTFSTQPEEFGIHGMNVIDAIEGGDLNGLDPESRAFAETARRLFDSRKPELERLGLVRHFLENYFTHLYKDPNVAQKWMEGWTGKRPMAGREQFRKERTYPTLREALSDPDFHLVAAFDNPVDFVYAGLAQMDKSITAHKVFNEWKDAGDLKLVRPGQRAPEGWDAIDDRIFRVYGPRQGAVKTPEGGQVYDYETGTHRPLKPGDITVIGRREMGQYFAPSGMARVANNWLSPGLRGKAPFDLWMGVKGGMNMLNLGFSAFHGMTTTLNASFSDMALGLKQLLAGHPVKATASVGRGMVPFASVVRDYIKGTYLEKVYDGRITDPTPEAQAAVEALKIAGGSPHQALYDPRHFREGLLKAFREGNYPGGIVRALNPLLWSETFTAPIMEKLVPRAKIAAFMNRVALELDEHPNMPEEEARQRFGAIWDSMDNRFGQLNQKNMLMNNVVKDLMNAVVGRPGWTIGTAREVLGGGGDVIKNVADLARGKKTELSDRTAYTVALFMGGALVNGMATAIMTGTMPHGMDYIAPRDGGKTEDGRPSRFVLPMYLSKDIYSWATRPVATFKAKLAQPLMIGSDLLENRDFQRHKIYGEGGIGVTKYLTQGALPYAAQGVQKNIERGESVSDTLLPLVGIMPAGKRVGLSDAEKIVTEYMDEHREVTTASPTDYSKAMAKIMQAARKGDVQEARQLARAGIDGGILSVTDVNRAMNRGKLSPLAADVKAVPLPVALNVYEAATAEERKVLAPVLRIKMQNARNEPKSWTPRAREQAARYFQFRPGTRPVVQPARYSIGIPASLQ